MNSKKKKRLLKIHPPLYKKIRRILINLFRHISRGRNHILLNQHPIAYIMLILSIWMLIGVYQNNELAGIPFIVGWVFIALCFTYFNFFPQTWDEMYEYEKIAWRRLYKLPLNWKPQNTKFGSEGRIGGKKHSTK